jgi:hypothetical protein
LKRYRIRAQNWSVAEGSQAINTRADPRGASSGRRVDPRYCRTHALVADLFANSSSSPVSAAAWSFNANAWAVLAALKEQMLEAQTAGRQGRPDAREPGRH